MSNGDACVVNDRVAGKEQACAACIAWIFHEADATGCRMNSAVSLDKIAHKSSLDRRDPFYSRGELNTHDPIVRNVVI